MPIQLQNEIIETKVISGHGSEENVSFVSTDKLYLLSTHEVWDDVNKNKNSIYYTAYNQTRQLDYYANLNVLLNKNYNYAQNNIIILITYGGFVQHMQVLRIFFIQ